MSDKTKRNLIDLKDALFLQIQNIQDPESHILVEEEIKKAGALCKLSEQIIKINQVEINAVKTLVEIKKSNVDITEIPAIENMLK